MSVINVAVLEAFAASLLTGLGAPADTATKVAESLVDATVARRGRAGYRPPVCQGVIAGLDGAVVGTRATVVRSIRSG